MSKNLNGEKSRSKWKIVRQHEKKGVGFKLH